MISTKIYWKPLSFVSIMLTLAACGKEQRVSSGDLPDLTKQSRSYVITDDTPVKAGPGPEFKTIALINSGAKIDVVGRNGDWLLIVSKRGNPPGFIEEGTARPGESKAREGGNENRKRDSAGEPVQGPYRVVANTEVREGPGLHYRSLAKVPKGIKINVIAAEDGWLKVQSKHGKPTGYVDQNHAEPMGSS